MNVLVTGGSGFIGSNLIKELVLRDDISSITVIDTEIFGRKQLTQSEKVVYYVDTILNETLLSKVLKKIDIVFHLAALISVAGSLNDPINYVNVNVLGTLILLEKCKEYKIKHFIFSSSCAAEFCNSHYSVDKLSSEKYINLYNSFFKTTILRYFNVYGNNQDPFKEYAAAVPIFVCNALNNQDIQIYGDGNQTRDFVSVLDVVKANIHCMEKGVTGKFNVGSGVSTSINDLANLIKTTCLKINPTGRSKLIYHLERHGDTKEINCDNSKLIETGFKFSVSLKDGISDFIEQINSKKVFH